jgi:hypothetical protein
MDIIEKNQELVPHITIFLSSLVIFFDFTTHFQHKALASCCVILIFNIKSYLWIFSIHCNSL